MKLEDIYIRDPYVLVFKDNFYLYGTTDKQCWRGKADGFKCYMSSDLINFEEYSVFKNDEKFWANEQFWAPEVHIIDNKFVMFASFSKDGTKRHSQILVANSPLGPFTPYEKCLFDEDFSYLDATYFQDDDGRKYTIFCYEWTDCKNGKICISELDDSLMVKDGTYRTLFTAKEASWTISKEGPGCFVTDGPFLVKKDGIYYLLWSSHSKDGYAMGYATSNEIYGPYLQHNTPIIRKDGGHGMIFKKDGHYYLTYHQPNFPHLEERMHYEEIILEKGKITLKK